MARSHRLVRGFTFYFLREHYSLLAKVFVSILISIKKVTYVLKQLNSAISYNTDHTLNESEGNISDTPELCVSIIHAFDAPTQRCGT